MRYLLIPERAVSNIETSVQMSTLCGDAVWIDATVELSILGGDPRYRVQYVDIVDGTVVHSASGVEQNEAISRSDCIRGIEAPSE